MTTNKNLPKPEHGTLQAQDVHEIKKEPKADSTKKQTSFPPSLIAVQTIRTVIEFILVLPLLPLLTIGLGGFLLFLPFGLHFILQAVAWSRAKKETRIAWVVGINIYSLMIVAPIGAFYTWFMMELQVAAPNITGADIGLLWWSLGACVLEAVISIVMIVVMNVIKRNDLRDFQGKRITVTKPRISDDVLEGSNSGAYETDGGLKPLKNHHDKSDAKVPRQHINVRSQKKD
ncbi:hypothetical protein HMPREF0733_10230 [Rothia dentocariosa ATCC 17931]|uniref:Uncharacterized protein n=1 Tax=Rothia dentocariosa (strain ATCC 17931 / CDC X599 / XDIA) TaxID=762948 RepID=E3H5E2_ROTDC|nr:MULTISPECIES: hypothetical protein [Rothia]ADP39688.1 hypothetical protein HMPREF0733_10230 [Rothia dentocariosa ATCC 17931]OFN45159.1 hypothetical protein HMPREF2554_03680 [Rothia sp. HMSC071F11]WMS30618.1 hypothetical protein RDV56_05790 [Rothia dentocariosa]SUE37597.1 Uncharacterised protein [Rothia dentocariosa]